MVARRGEFWSARKVAWQEYLGVTGDEARAFLHRFLAQRLTPEREGWIAPYLKRAAVIWWRTSGVK